jgi:hypothetical protein
VRLVGVSVRPDGVFYSAADLIVGSHQEGAYAVMKCACGASVSRVFRRFVC